jgi:hypothetical protein
MRRSVTYVPGSELLTNLIYELLDAHADTQQLLRAVGGEDVATRMHLDYLTDLQRVGREILAGMNHPDLEHS